jgi:hypothetical protein
MSEKVYCWRCKRFISMLNDQEYEEVREVYRQCILNIKAYRKEHGTYLSDTPVFKLHAPVRDAYERITGETGVDHDEILKHHVSNFGPPCPKCGKNLRTSKANKCFECHKQT